MVAQNILLWSAKFYAKFCNTINKIFWVYGFICNSKTTTLELKLLVFSNLYRFAKLMYSINLPQVKQTSKLLVSSTALFKLFFLCMQNSCY